MYEAAIPQKYIIYAPFILKDLKSKESTHLITYKVVNVINCWHHPACSNSIAVDTGCSPPHNNNFFIRHAHSGNLYTHYKQ